MIGRIYFIILMVLHSTSIAIAGIAATKHNLSMTGPGVVKSGVEDRICVFCHTPHSATVNIDGLHVPLWNHTLSNAVYTLSASPTMKSVPQNPPDGDSRLCLSCHDGTVAIGSVARSGYSPSIINVEGTGTGGVMPGVAGDPGSSNLGTDLSGHHPVSLEVNTALINAKNTQCNDPVSPISWRVCFPSAGNAVKMRPTNNLYGAGSHTKTGVQCSSCHDPHEDSPSGNKFLRVDISDPVLGIDPLCLACHRDCDLACP
ncbi:MAG: ammonia-forming cytochrome c nitrite reductase subunit c552 [Nitrospirae bacterium]|nr:ammonia-forming cytochrome c nitrite reductase subunit c552 [Nitrospirota bacterium]